MRGVAHFGLQMKLPWRCDKVASVILSQKLISAVKIQVLLVEAKVGVSGGGNCAE